MASITCSCGTMPPGANQHTRSSITLLPAMRVIFSMHSSTEPKTAMCSATTSKGRCAASELRRRRAPAHAEQEPAMAEHIDLGRLLGHGHGVVQGKLDHARAQPDAPGLARQGRSHGQGRGNQ
jgi:hypothetical protein